MRMIPVVTFAAVSLLGSYPLAHADDVAEGRDVYLRLCLSCHAFACNKEGPRLGGLFGRKAGGVEDYDAYSEGLKNSELVWTRVTLDAWFKDPARIAPNSVMVYSGKVEDPEQRRKLIAFLRTEDPTVDICLH